MRLWHYLAHSVEHFKIMGIVVIENSSGTNNALKNILTNFEGYFQIKLQTLKPWGMNLKDEFLMRITMKRPGART